jgi:hypothetical protein
MELSGQLHGMDAFTSEEISPGTHCIMRFGWALELVRMFGRGETFPSPVENQTPISVLCIA